MNIAMLTDTYLPHVNGVSTSLFLFRNTWKGLVIVFISFLPLVKKGIPIFSK